MAETRSKPVASQRTDVAALILLVVGIGVATAIVSYSPSVSEERIASDLLGWPGAMLAESIFEALGVAVYSLLASWFLLAIALFLRRDMWRWSARLAGHALLLPCAAVAADQLANVLPSPTWAGSGGTPGAGIVQWLIEHVTPVGRVAVFSAALALGVYLAFDNAVVWLERRLSQTLRWTWRRLSRVRFPTLRRRPEGQPIIRMDSSPRVASDARLVPTPRSNSDLKLAEASSIPLNFELPPVKLLDDPEPFPHEQHDEHLRQTAALLEKTFTDFGMNVRVVGIHTGPVITQYEIALETGLRVNKVTVLSDDLALNLKVPSVRIIAPIPGKNTVGIEVPNEHRAMVRL